MNNKQIYKQLLHDFDKAYNHVIGCSDKTNRDYWILTEWKVSIDKLLPPTNQQNPTKQLMCRANCLNKTKSLNSG